MVREGVDFADFEVSGECPYQGPVSLDDVFHGAFCVDDWFAQPVVGCFGEAVDFIVSSGGGFHNELLRTLVSYYLHHTFVYIQNRYICVYSCPRQFLVEEITPLGG